MNRARVVSLVWLVVAAAIGVAPAAAAQEDTEMARLRQDFGVAEATFNSINQPDSIPDFSRIISVLGRRLAAEQDDEARTLLVASLVYRARAHFNNGANDEAAADTRALIAANPDAVLDRVQMSPRFLEMFDAIHAETVGHLEFAVSPADAEIRVDGRLLPAGVVSHAVAGGSHAVVVERAGYQPVQEELEVAARGSVLVDHVLLRLSAVVKVLTRPAGARITIDGTVLDVTSGVAPPTFAPTGDEALYPAADFSDELEIEGLLPGAYTLEVSLEGYRSRRYDLDIVDLEDYRAVVVLEETRGTVVLEGLPGDARITVDGVSATPQQAAGAPQLEVAPGVHTVEVSQGTAGVFSTKVEVADQQTRVVQVRIRPGLAFLGVLGGDERGADDLTELLLGTLGAIDSWTVLDRAWAAPAFARVDLTPEALRVAAEQATPTPDWNAVQATLDREAPGSVYMLGVLNDDLLATHADLWIWPAAPGPSQPDRVRVALDGSADVATLAGAFQTSTFLAGTWLGAQLVDIGDGVTVAAVSSGGPADAAGLMVGDRVASIAGQNITAAAAARMAVDKAVPGTVVAVQVQRGGATQVLEIALGATAKVISPSDPQLVYSVMSASLAAEDADPDGLTPDWVVRLNQAAVLAHVGEWEEVVRLLRSIENAPSGAGVGQAAVDYWLGIALTELGPTYRDRAIQAFERAAADPEARLFHNDGPWVAPRAVARLAELGAR